MEKKHVIIIILAIIILLAGSVAFMTLNQTKYQTINISNATTIEAPVADDVSWTVDENGIKTYACPSKHTSLMSFNSEENTGIVGAAAYAQARDSMLEGASDVENYNGYAIKENTINNVKYYIVSTANNSTHDNIVICSESLDILHHMLDSLKYGNGNASSTNSTAPVKADSNSTNGTSSSNSASNNGEVKNSGSSKEDYYNRMGLNEGHVQASAPESSGGSSDSGGASPDASDSDQKVMLVSTAR